MVSRVAAGRTVAAMNMRSTGTDPPDEPTATPAARQNGANVIALSADPALITLTRDSLAGSHRVWRADDATHASDLIVAAGNAVLLIDASLADHDTRSLVSAIHQQFPDLPIIVAGRRDDEVELAALVAQGAIFRFLHKPASAERIRNFVEATQRREPSGSDRPAAVPGATFRQALQAQLVRLRPPRLRLDRDRLRHKLRRSLLLLPLLAGIAALLLWEPWRYLGELRSEQPPAPAAPVDAGRDRAVLRLLDAAGIAFSQGRLTEPPERNAYELYRAVLARDPGDRIATQGIQRIADQLALDADHALAATDLLRLAEAIDALRSVQPGHPRLPDLVQQLGRERARRTEARSARTVTDATAGRALDATAMRTDAGRVPSFVQLANQRMASGHLVGGSDSAHAYLFAARRLDPADLSVRQGILMLGALLENNARRELAAGRLDAASVWVHDAIALNHDRAALARLRADLELARLRSQPVDQPLLPPVTPAAPAGAVPAAVLLPEAQLVRRRFRMPDYPQQAVIDHVEGWVDIEFTVAAEGTTRDPRIVAAEPAGVFETATLEALARWRYQPVTVDGVPVARRVTMRLRFDLGD